MIPDSPDFFSQDENTESYEILPTKTYKLDTVNKRIIGVIEDREAVLQFIRKVLSTDKYAFEIYDWYYGNELLKLVGQPYDYAVTRIPNIFKEALLVDDRIIDVRDFTFNQPSIDTILVTCVVDTVYGQVAYEQEVAT
jgi:hypothetical protein